MPNPFVRILCLVDLVLDEESASGKRNNDDDDEVAGPWSRGPGPTEEFAQEFSPEPGSELDNDYGHRQISKDTRENLPYRSILGVRTDRAAGER